MKTVFKVGDKVYDARYGWGIVTSNNALGCYPINVNYEAEARDITYTYEGKVLNSDLIPTLSFTEYKLEGFSQERPEVLPNRGDVVWVRNNENEDWLCVAFMCKIDEYYRATCWNPFNVDNGFQYKFLTTTNPYSNETN